VPATGPFSSEKDGGNFSRLFEECLRQGRLNPRSLYHRLLRDTGEPISEKTIASWRRPHSTTGRVVSPKEETARVVAAWLSKQEGVSVTEEELLAAWQSDKAAQSARRDRRRGSSDDPAHVPSAGPPAGVVTFLSARAAGVASANVLGTLGGIVAAHGGAAMGGHRGGFLAAFADPAGAVAAGAAFRRDEMLRRVASMAIHTGPAALTPSGYAGLAVHQVDQMCAAAHPGQVVVSKAAADLLRPVIPAGARLIDLGDVRLRDLSEPHHLLELREPDLSGDFPPLKSLDEHPHNLPLQLTTFIGREAQMEELREALAASRLCSLTGAGGSGKTRLALQLAAELIDDFGDGVWVVDLTSTPDPDDLAQTVSSALGVRQGGTGTYAARSGQGRRRPAMERLTEHLRHRHVLVLLDNCEHLVEPCAALVEELLRACSDLKVLCTSRERLGIDGELEYRVPPLTMPPAGNVLTVDALTDFESVRLFLDRAAHRRPELDMSADDIAAVGEICRRVDGSALAIELAAARVRLLSPTEILDRLDDRLALLTSGSRTAPARHQTLRSMIDWSHDDLSPTQKTLLRRLSVFVGGFDLAAAQDVCSGEGLERFEILDLLGMLVDKSLVETEQQAGVTRCRLLETIRSYGSEKLAECDEHERFSARHQDWYLGLAEQAEDGLTGAEQRRWLDTLEADHDNLRAALAHGQDNAAAEKCLRLAAALAHFWLVRGFLTEGRQHLEDALARVGAAPTTLRAKALAVAGHLAIFDSDIETAAQHSEAALELSSTLGYRRGQAWALRTLGRVASGREQFDEARALQDRALAISQELSDTWGTTFLLTNIANLEALAGRFEEANRYYEQSLLMRRGTGDDWGVVWTSFRIGVLRTWQGRFDDARRLLTEGLELADELRYGAGRVLTLLGLGDCEHLVDDQAAAEARYVEAHTVACDLEDQTGISLAVVGLAGVAMVSGEVRAARRWLAREEMERSASTRSTYAAWLRAEARLARACGDAASAVELQRNVLALRQGLGDVRAMAESLEDLGVLYAEGHRWARAATLLAAAADTRARMGAPVPPLYADEVGSARGKVGPAAPVPLDDAVVAELRDPSG
jgi:predicted ATPase